MYMESINDVMEQDNNTMFSVSFLKKHTDGLITGQIRDIICDVDDTDVLKMSIPSDDILSGKAAIVRVKLSFDSGEINAARIQCVSRLHKKPLLQLHDEGAVTNLL